MIKNQLPKILMVSTEYPPMRGGVGRYTFNLVRQLRKKGLNVLVASNEEGSYLMQRLSRLSRSLWTGISPC